MDYNKAKVRFAAVLLVILFSMSQAEDNDPPTSEETTKTGAKEPPTIEEATKLCEIYKFEEFIITNPSDEQYFIICSGNIGFVGDCGTGNCFDKSSGKCGVCPNVCNGKEILDQVPSLNDCQKYYICMGTVNNPVPITCPSTQHYSETQKQCTSPLEADCVTRDDLCKGQNDGKVFEGKKCFEYLECYKDVTLDKSCPYNQYFEKQNGTCVTGVCTNLDGTTSEREPVCSTGLDGMKMVHPKCYKYYVCLNKILYEGQCGTGYYYNAQLKNCVTDVNGECNDD